MKNDTCAAFTNCLRAHIQNHPLLLPQDVVKFCYQAAYGAEHLLADTAAARAYFDAEYKTVVPSGKAVLMEELNEFYGRVSLSAWKAEGLQSDRLFALFCGGAMKIPTQEERAEREERMQRYLETASRLAAAEQTPYAEADWLTFLESYRACGFGPVHHSDAYRQAYHPAYRVVRLEQLRAETDGDAQKGYADENH